MGQPYTSRHRAKRTSRPLDPARLEELALAYVARFSTSAARLEAYLGRKLRERGYTGAEEGESAPDIGALVASFVARGYVDDAGYARVRAGDLLRRGYGARRIDQALNAAGIGPELCERMSPGEAERREAALALARRRRFGPYGGEPPVSPEERWRLREKRLAAMLRAGHDLAIAATVLDAASIDELEAWAAEAREDQDL